MGLKIQNISKTFRLTGGLFFSQKMKVQALKNVSAEIAEGSSLGIVGESGSGKTTLAKILAGFITPDSGLAQLDEIDLIKSRRRDRSKIVQMVFQDPFSSLNPKLLIGTQIYESLEKQKIQNIKERAAQLMKDVGLSSDFLTRYPHQLSGGQRQRFAIARALTMEPKLLLADEPVSSLDLSVQAQIINLLNRLRHEKKFTQVVISHDLAVIANLCDRVIVMKDGEVLEEGPISNILSSPKNAYTKRLLTATPVV